MHRSDNSLFFHLWPNESFKWLSIKIWWPRGFEPARWRTRRVRRHKVTYFFTFHMIDVVVPRDVNKYVNRCLKCNEVYPGLKTGSQFGRSWPIITQTDHEPASMICVMMFSWYLYNAIIVQFWVRLLPVKDISTSGQTSNHFTLSQRITGRFWAWSLVEK